MKPLAGLLVLLCATAASADPTLLLGEDATFAKASQKELLAATASPETRVRLLAWTALRDQGVQPEEEEAWTVRGMAVETSDGAVVVYDDGRLRWSDAEGKVTAVESQTREIARLAKAMMYAAESAMKTTRPMPRPDSSSLDKERVRITVLTYAGFYVIEAHAEAMGEDGGVVAAREMLEALTRIEN